MYCLYMYIIIISGKLLHFTDVINIDETALIAISRTYSNSVCKFSAKSAIVKR